jgi:hypothetical protein
VGIVPVEAVEPDVPLMPPRAGRTSSCRVPRLRHDTGVVGPPRDTSDGTTVPSGASGNPHQTRDFPIGSAGAGRWTCVVAPHRSVPADGRGPARRAPHDRILAPHRLWIRGLHARSPRIAVSADPDQLGSSSGSPTVRTTGRSERCSMRSSTRSPRARSSLMSTRLIPPWRPPCDSRVRRRSGSMVVMSTRRMWIPATTRPGAASTGRRTACVVSRSVPGSRTRSGDDHARWRGRTGRWRPVRTSGAEPRTPRRRRDPGSQR